jgi:hypothetical protein
MLDFQGMLRGEDDMPMNPQAKAVLEPEPVIDAYKRHIDRSYVKLEVCPSNAILLRQTICRHLRRSRPEKILNVFQRIRLRFSLACGLASTSRSFAS